MKGDKFIITRNQEQAQELLQQGFKLIQLSEEGVYIFLTNDRLDFQVSPETVITNTIFI